MRYLPTIICLLGFAYGSVQAVYISENANSVMHQLYGGQYGIVAAMFLCTWMIISAISKK